MYKNDTVMKMQGYATRMQELVNEAYADGIVLEVRPAEDEKDLSPITKEQFVQRLFVGIPVNDHFHPNMRLPAGVMASAVVTKYTEDSEPTIVPPLLLKPKTVFSPLVPIPRPENEHLFVDVSLIPDILVHGKKTRPLRFGETFDLLSLSLTDETLPTVMIDAAVALKSFCYRDMDTGKVHTVDTLYLPYAGFYAATNGDYRDLQINISLAKKYEKDWGLASGDDDAWFTIEGKLNLQFGTLRLIATSNKPNLVPLGYMLEARLSSTAEE